MGYYITTSDNTRLGMWRKLFRSWRLPVKSAKPRWQSIPGKLVEIPAYDLDAARLTEKQQTKFGRYIADVYKLSEEQAAKRMDNWPIEAKNCTVVVN